MKKTVAAILTALLAAFVPAGCGQTFVPAEPEEVVLESEAAVEVAQISEVIPTPTPEPTPEPFQEYDIRLMAVGDNLMHMGIVHTGEQADGTRNYDILFEGISDYLALADIKMINQETIFGGNQLGFSGFPLFNSPTEVGDAVVKAGFNVVTQATNHTADQGLNGITHCISYWNQFPEVLVSGLGGEDRPDIPIFEIDGFKFAILNYTYGPNMGTIPKSIQPYLKMLCNYNPGNGIIDFTSINPQVLEDIAQAKEMADFVIVAPHWGTEYQIKPSSYQEKFALQMTEAGADIIIGTHPHVPQPIEWITADNGNRCLCYYSLGNYVSTQRELNSLLEGMAWIVFHVTEDGIFLDEEQTGVVPIVCHYKSGPVRFVGVYPLTEYSEEMAQTHGVRSYGALNLHYKDLLTRSREIFRDKIVIPAGIYGDEAIDPTDIFGEVPDTPLYIPGARPVTPSGGGTGNGNAQAQNNVTASPVSPEEGCSGVPLLPVEDDEEEWEEPDDEPETPAEDDEAA